MKKVCFFIVAAICASTAGFAQDTINPLKGDIRVTSTNKIYQLNSEI
jgi:hypothetical protein